MPLLKLSLLTKHYQRDNTMRALFTCLSLVFALNTQVWAVDPAAAAPATAAVTPTPATTAPVATTNTTAATVSNKPTTAEEIAKDKIQQEAKIKALVKDQASRLQQLEKANLEALTQNQELQLKNDNLAVQVQVLQSESSAQMFLYGAATITVGVLLGFFIAGYIYNKRRRQW